jgi:enterochelin esterase-like enzyme
MRPNRKRTFSCAVGAFAVIATLGGVPASPARADLISSFRDNAVLGDALAGKLVKTSFPAPSLRGSRTVYVYTPPNYSESAAKAYPVLILLHGAPGQPLDWLYKGGAHKTLDAAIKAGRFPAAVLAVPDGTGPYSKGSSEWADAVDGRCKMETAITSDLVGFLKFHYHVSSDPRQWTLGGLSEGGYGAANLVVRHPDLFRNALVLSGEFAVNDEWDDARQVFGDDPVNRAKNSPVEQIRKLPADVRKSLHFYVAVGADDDADLIAENESFVGVCRALGVPVRFDRDPGAHKWGFWGPHLKTALDALAGWLPSR